MVFIPTFSSSLKTFRFRVWVTNKYHPYLLASKIIFYLPRSYFHLPFVIYLSWDFCILKFLFHQKVFFLINKLHSIAGAEILCKIHVWSLFCSYKSSFSKNTLENQFLVLLYFSVFSVFYIKRAGAFWFCLFFIKTNVL